MIIKIYVYDQFIHIAYTWWNFYIQYDKKNFVSSAYFYLFEYIWDITAGTEKKKKTIQIKCLWPWRRVTDVSQRKHIMELNFSGFTQPIACFYWKLYAIVRFDLMRALIIIYVYENLRFFKVKYELLVDSKYFFSKN